MCTALPVALGGTTGVTRDVSASGVFFEMDHPVIGPARFEGNPFRFSSTQSDNWRSAPLLGEDNEYVFKEIVGVAEDEYDDLVAGGVL